MYSRKDEKRRNVRNCKVEKKPVPNRSGYCTKFPVCQKWKKREDPRCRNRKRGVPLKKGVIEIV